MSPRNVLHAAGRYRLVTATLVVGAVGGVLWAVGLPLAVQLMFSGFALGVAVVSGIQMARELAHGTFGIDVLAVIAIVSTVLVGEYVASIIIVLMVAGGRALEDFAEGRAQRELSALLAREPQVAHRVDSSGAGDDITAVRDISAPEVDVGDTILVRSGEVVPVDGQLLSAGGSFDESSLTGESLPVYRVAGQGVLSGSINGLNAVTLRATATAAHSQFQGIVALVRQAQENRAPVVRLADRYAVPFTAVSLAIAVTAWIASGDPVRFAEVLVLATPCPLVLAAPVAFMGGMSRAATNGVIVKGGSVLEMLARVKTVVLDKTGTLTHGTPAITRVNARAPHTAESLLTLVASAEQFSSHVLAASLVDEAKKRGLTLSEASDTVERAAAGITATVEGRSVALGTFAFVHEVAPQTTRATSAPGELVIYVAVDGAFAGTILGADPIRANARGTIDRLRTLGITDVVMLTGDAQTTAQHVANAVGIASFRADCLPKDKLSAVREMPRRPVMMVGDGVNDAPVLAAAEVGIAMGAKGASAASESAAAVILIDDLSRIVRAITIGRETVRIALQSIWLGIALSLILMVIAAFGLIPATAGAAIQELVDLASILNALRATRGLRSGRLRRRGV